MTRRLTKPGTQSSQRLVAACVSQAVRPAGTPAATHRPTTLRCRVRRWVTAGSQNAAAIPAIVLVALIVGCSPSGGTGTGQATPNADLAGGYGDFSFDIADPAATTNGAEEDAADPEAGAALYRSAEQACAVCHGTNAEGAALGEPLVGTSAQRLEEVLEGDDDHQNVSRPTLTNEDYLDIEAFLATVGQDLDSNGADTGTNG